MLVWQILHPQIHAVLVLHPVLEHVELQRAHHAHNDLLHAGVRHLEDLNGALLGDLLRALDELLALHGVPGADPGEMLRGKGGDPLKPENLSRHRQGVADGVDARVEYADDVAGVGFLHDLPVLGHQGLGLGKALLFAALDVVDLHVPGELAGGDAHKGDPVPVGLVHVGLDLEDKGGKVRGEGVDDLVAGGPGQGRGGHVQKFVQERLHAEGGQSRAEEHGALLSRPDLLQVELRPCAQQLHFLLELLPLFLADELAHMGILQIHLLRAASGFEGGVGEEQNLAAGPVVDPLKLLAGADGPVDGAGLDAQLLLDLLAQLKGVPGVPVHLVDEGEDGDVPQGADLEELSGLGFHALAAVDDHDGGVRGHQGPVGVLGAVLVTRGVENVDAVAVVGELQHRGGHGDAALFFNFHPVGNGGPAVFLALDHACLGDGAAVEQELLGQGGLTGVGVGDDGKGTPPPDLFLHSHNGSSIVSE